MFPGFLEKLPLSAEEKRTVAQLAAPNAAALLAMIKAAPEAVATLLGWDRTRDLEGVLVEHVSDAEKVVINAPAQRTFKTGAVISRRAPTLSPPSYRVEDRDALFAQLQELRREGGDSAEARSQIKELEQNLNELLKEA